MNTTYEKARDFIYRNARPLDFARWQYHFENGNQKNVLNILLHYQNKDGGFGHALEADALNPISSPIQTWVATERLREIGFTDSTHPLIQGILHYLGSGVDFFTEHNQWLNCVPTNNDYPHAIWWEYKDGSEQFTYNPTACLAGFIIRFAEKESPIYQMGCEIVKQAYHYFVTHVPFSEMHVTSCFIRLYEYCLEANTDLINMTEFKQKLKQQVNFNICKDIEKWDKEYVTKPSEFINSPDSIFFEENKDLVEYECEFIVNTQQPDGAYPVTWQWWNEYKEFEITANWWKSYFIITNMLYLKTFGKL